MGQRIPEKEIANFQFVCMINLNSILATYPEWGQKVPLPSLFGGEKRPRLSLSTPSGGWHMRTHNRYMPVLIMEKRILQMRLQIALSVSIVILVKY